MKTKRTKLLDRRYNNRDAKLFIVATEGQKTEKQYFEMFHSSRIKLEFLTAGEENRSAPQWVLDRLERFKQKYDLGENDELWLVFDVDRWEQKNLRAVSSEATQKSYGLAISNPCFETWLYLHFAEPNPEELECKQVKLRLRQHLGSYNSSKLSIEAFQPQIQNAIDRARKLHPDPHQYWTSTPGSYVYRLVESILATINRL